MINLHQYRKYWEDIAASTHGITGVLPITLDDRMGRKIQSLAADSLTLFVLPPLAESTARDADTFSEVNKCVVFVMAKYDPQRLSSFEVLERTQPVVDKIKQQMTVGQRGGCARFIIRAGSIDTAPETELYGQFAGWSIGFEIISTGYATD